MSIEVRDICCVRGGRTVLHGVTLAVRPGRVLALVGPNGAGKSSLLSVMCADLAVVSGEVRLHGKSLATWGSRELARERAVLTQANDVSFAFTALEVVQMGRNPWTGQPESAADDDVVEVAMQRTDVTHLAQRSFQSLSGGERARVSLARVLAQDTPVVLLDEPTAALDLRHQEDVMTLARDLAREGRTVVVVLHDLSLAAAYADDVAVLADGRLAALGSPHDVLTPKTIEQVYGVAVHLVATPNGHHAVVPVRANSSPNHVAAPALAQHHLTPQETP